MKWKTTMKRLYKTKRQLNKTGTTLVTNVIKPVLKSQEKFLLQTIESHQFITEQVGHLATLWWLIFPLCCDGFLC